MLEDFILFRAAIEATVVLYFLAIDQSVSPGSTTCMSLALDLRSSFLACACLPAFAALPAEAFLLPSLFERYPNVWSFSFS